MEYAPDATFKVERVSHELLETGLQNSEERESVCIPHWPKIIWLQGFKWFFWEWAKNTTESESHPGARRLSAWRKRTVVKGPHGGHLMKLSVERTFTGGAHSLYACVWSIHVDYVLSFVEVQLHLLLAPSIIVWLTKLLQNVVCVATSKAPCLGITFVYYCRVIVEIYFYLLLEDGDMFYFATMTRIQCGLDW